MLDAKKTSALGQQMSSLVGEMESKYCGRSDTRLSSTSALGAVLFHNNKEDFLRNYKRNPVSKVSRIGQASVAAPMVVAMIAFPPMIPVLAPITAVVVGGIEVVKRRMNNEGKKSADLIPGAKDTLTQMIKTLEKAKKEFERDPAKNREQLQESVSSFESLWTRENGFFDGTFVKGKGLDFPKSNPMDPALEKAINSCYSKSASLLSSPLGPPTGRGIDPGLSKGIDGLDVSQNEYRAGPQMGI